MVAPYRRKLNSGADELMQAPFTQQRNNTRGDLQYWDGTGWQRLPKGTAGEVLVVTNGIPAWKSLLEAGIAPSDADYLVGSAQAGLSAEIVAGPTPAGELGGTWGGPTVNATHSGSAHHTRGHDMDGASDHNAGTQGDILYAGAAGAWAKLGAGTSGEVLITGGAGANPSWGAAGAAGHFFIPFGSEVNEGKATTP